MNDGDALLALMAQARERGASDLVLAAGSPPMLYREGRITGQEALSKAADPDRLEKLLRRGGPAPEAVAAGEGGRKPWE